MTNHLPRTSFELASCAANAAESKKSVETRVMEVGKISSIADYFVFCVGESPAQLKAIATEVMHNLEEMGYEPIGQERDRVGQWFLIDYGEIVVHVMHPKMREFYNLETFWSHATPIVRDKWEHKIQKAAS